MFIIIVLLALLIVFDIAAMRWGSNSSDGLDSKEWERRWQLAWPEQHSEKHPMNHIRGKAVRTDYDRLATTSRRGRSLSPGMSTI